ncbi:MAG: hypothetical protein U9Q29_08750 [Campylobacterota bacterium]|nr:hypothetical protein [Campylobacterota bacterium]
MKTLFIVTFLLLTINLSSNELAWVDEQVDAIKPPRSGIKNSTISRLKDPFIFLRKNSSKKEGSKKSSTTRRVVPSSTVASSSSAKATKSIAVAKKSLTIDAIMNTSALISGKWYKINDKVGNYTLSSVSRTSVVLTRNGKNLVLSTDSRNLNLKFKNK